MPLFCIYNAGPVQEAVFKGETVQRDDEAQAEELLRDKR